MDLKVMPIVGLPMIQDGDDIAKILAQHTGSDGPPIEEGDILVVAQKIVSKSEGRLISLKNVVPSTKAIELGAETEKDPRLVELMLQESTEVVRKKPGVLILRHRLGHVGAHAGIDQSNIAHSEEDSALLLPIDPDRSARKLVEDLKSLLGIDIGVLISDSGNRPWRIGTVGMAIGAYGFPVLDDHRGGVVLYGRELKVTLINRADSIATAATLVMGETTEGVPAAIVRGFDWEPSKQTAAEINRPLEEDLFR